MKSILLIVSKVINKDITTPVHDIALMPPLSTFNPFSTLSSAFISNFEQAISSSNYFLLILKVFSCFFFQAQTFLFQVTTKAVDKHDECF